MSDGKIKLSSKPSVSFDKTKDYIVGVKENGDVVRFSGEEIILNNENVFDESKLNDYVKKTDLSPYAKTSDIPKTLKNPNPITFTGGASGTYDGSSPLTINIPTGGTISSSPFYNANNHGISTSNSDNTNAIQSLIDTVWRKGGGTIYFDTGVYKIKQLNLRSKVSIIGNGMGSTIFKCIGTSGLKGVLHFPAYSGFSICKCFAIDGNQQPTNGIYFEPTGYVGTYGQTLGNQPYDIIANSSVIVLDENMRNPLKNIFFDYIAVYKCGNGKSSCYDDRNCYCGIQLRDDDAQSLISGDAYYGNYSLDFKHMWVYSNDNGIVWACTDSSFGDSYIDANLYGGLFVLGGNNKFYTIKCIWNGRALQGTDNSDCPAFALNNWTGQNFFVNFECQDNQSTDIKVQGVNNMLTNLLVDGANQYAKKKKYKIAVYGSGNTVHGALANYANTKASVGIAGTCNSCDIRFTAPSSSCDQLTSVINDGGETKIISY